ncbi:MAG TPA: hypothetical protein VFV38_28665 [Ktedonobacteraceae bacterium]|nr:hypothetical protein [Ktedonobacteraceae bacterium]
MEPGTPRAKQSPKGYGKRPLWQWIVLYVIIGGLLYGLIYYFVIAKQGGYGSTSTTKQYPSPTSQITPSAPMSAIYMLKTDSSNNTYLADAHGMALYTYDGDTAGAAKSTCTGSCAESWPPYSSGSTTEADLPADITIITRSDGSKQFAWKGKPLYYFISDTQAGQTTGDGINGFHLAR